ncbi:MAG TPA: aminotransferase class I/II-fold pyridoxal phosphate-dependent enzyme [Salinisphaeraceae bacterium]|nr:aminotransferase class I/II-fold pyridoxal phosphate-dependent enzyme [Salinisphaeraceae bacterium]
MPTFAQLDAITLADLRATGATKWKREDGALGAFVAEMDYGVAQPIKDALHAAVEQGLFAYLPEHYRDQMQASVAAWLQRQSGWQVPRERIHEMPDVVAVYRAAMEHFTPPGGKIIVPTPSYMPFLSVPASVGREVIEVPMSVDSNGYHFTHVLAALERAFDTGGRLLVLCNPHNPTGRVFHRAELAAIEELVERKGGRVFADEIWSPLVFPGHQHISYAAMGAAAAGHTITATAASKAFNLPGLKCAQLITSNEADEEKWRAVGHFPMHGAANLGLVGTAAAFAECQPWLDDILAYLKRNRDLLTEFVAERMPHARVTRPEATYVAWLDLTDYALETDPQTFLLEQAGVMCTVGTACGRVGTGHVRFIFAMPKPLMLEALERMAQALEQVPVRA